MAHFAGPSSVQLGPRQPRAGARKRPPRGDHSPARAARTWIKRNQRGGGERGREGGGKTEKESTCTDECVSFSNDCEVVSVKRWSIFIE